MEFTSKEQLYNKLLPVFKVKKRLLKYYKQENIKEIDIWQYLIKNKWTKTINLTLEEIVNDIITLDINNLINKEVST